MDLIDRQAAIDALWTIQRNLQMIDASEGADITIHGVQLALHKIEQLPPAQPEHATCYLDSPCEYQNPGIKIPMPTAEPRWIPCSERLPDEDGYYLVTNSKLGAPWREITLWMTDGWSSDNKPIAWMPLPEPWKGEDNGVNQ